MYTVNSYDICAPGFERLRSQSEFIIPVTVYRHISGDVIREEMKADIQRYAQPDGFDFEACRQAIDAFIDSEIKGREHKLFGDIDPPEGDEKGCNLFVYITGPGHSDPSDNL